MQHSSSWRCGTERSGQLRAEASHTRLPYIQFNVLYFHGALTIDTAIPHRLQVPMEKQVKNAWQQTSRTSEGNRNRFVTDLSEPRKGGTTSVGMLPVAKLLFWKYLDVSLIL